MSLLTYARAAGAMEELDTQRPEVFAHGTFASFGRRLINEGGACLAPTGGRHGGKFFTVPNLDVAKVFAQRACSNAKGQAPIIVGLALHPDLAAQWLRNRMLVRKTIDNPPPGVPVGSIEHIFFPSTFVLLARDGFFFEIR